MPEGAVYVGRPSKWGNPYAFGALDPDARGVNRLMLTADSLVRAYRGYAKRSVEVNSGWTKPLRGRTLACWCPLDQPCHADVLLEIANA